MFLRTNFWDSLRERLDLIRDKYEQVDSISDLNEEEEVEKVCLINELPVEVILTIFSWLDSQSACQCRLVSRSWKMIATDDHLWKLYLSYEEPLQVKWRNLHLSDDYKNIFGVFATGAFNYSISMVETRPSFIDHKQKNEELYQDVSCLSANFSEKADDAMIAEVLIPEENYLSELSILNLKVGRKRKYNPSITYLALRQIGKHCPHFTSLISDGTNLDDQSIQIISKYIPTLEQLSVRNTLVTEKSIDDLRRKRQKLHVKF